MSVKLTSRLHAPHKATAERVRLLAVFSRSNRRVACRSSFVLAAAQVLVQEDGFRDLTHGLASLTTFALHPTIGFILGEVEGPLQGALG